MNFTPPPAWKHINFCPSCGTENRTAQEKRTVPFTCASCGYRQYFNPSIGVVGIVVNHDNHCLFLRREKDPARGKLGLPGGFADFQESAEEALAREIMEETALIPSSINYLCSDTNTYPYGGVTYLVMDLFYVCQVDSFDNIILQDSEVSSPHIAIPTISELQKMAFPSNRRALEKYYRIQSP